MSPTTIPVTSIKATLKPVGKVDLGWPEMDTIALFPGYRQSVPWHDPATASHAKRVSFKQPLATARARLSLNGTWQRAFFHQRVPAEVPPADARWLPVGVPMMQIELEQSPRRQFGAYFRRTFKVGDRRAAGTYRLVVNNVGCHGTVFVNGRKMGTIAGANTPLVMDVSSVLRPGSNELLIIVRDILAVMDPAYVNPKAPLASPLYLDAPGSFRPAPGSFSATCCWRCLPPWPPMNCSSAPRIGRNASRRISPWSITASGPFGRWSKPRCWMPVARCWRWVGKRWRSRLASQSP